MKDADALDKIAYLVKEDCEGEGWTDMSGIIESITDYVERTGRDVSPHE